jgi:selenocysteine-specific elongation factor
MRVIATAGHVDHGKSALVRALSGIEPDRLAEEQARGLTIDLGFAWMDLPIADAEQPESVGMVDVPGHIDFIKNMLAGVGSVDAVMLVIAADEGVMPQTREHLAILDLLAVPAGVVVLTKVDLIDDPEWLDLVELDIHDLLADTRLAQAPMVRVSAKTGQGLDRLRETLSQTLVALPPRRNRNRPRLPMDRIFSLSGFGTVVTGTLSDGEFRVGDPVVVLPDGPQGRVRGLQSHKQSVEIAQPGSRVAMNLSSISPDQIRRGQVVCKPDTLRATRLIDVAFRLLPDAAKPLTHNTLVDLFSGASEVQAHVRLLGTEELLPGQEGWLQLRLKEPMLVAAGDRYILRQPSPSQTLGGGVALNPHPRQRYRRFDQAALERLAVLAKGAPDEILLQTLERSPLLSQADLIAQSGLGVEPAAEALAELTASAAVIPVEGGLLVTNTARQQLWAQMARLLTDFHREHPLRRAMPRGEVRSRLSLPGQQGGARDLPVRAFNHLVAQAMVDGLVQADENGLWLPGHAIRYTPKQQQGVDQLLARFAQAPFAPPNQPESLALLSGEEALLDSLIEQGILVRLPGNVLLRAEDFETMYLAVMDHLAQHGSITLAEVRDRFDTSRKYAQALLEELDARRLTRREGEGRVLR